MGSYTYSQTFTVTHAKYLASKVAADLKRLQRFYGDPSDLRINDYEEEIVQLLKNGYLKEITYGFKRGENWIEPTLRYTAKDLANSSIDDDPGKVRPDADTDGASFYSFLTYSSAYDNSSQSEREAFESNLPFKRVDASEPSADGYFSNDRYYYSGGKGLDRSSLKKY
ncbi:MAG: hypothetical protein OXH57_01310 [Ekhidna sp.]|nr:hypothetical protein [Ekhidna sp.]